MKTPALESFTTFGDLLRYLRQRQQLTQRDLGLAVGYGDAQITRLERNTRLPDVSVVAAQFIPALHLEDEPEVAARLIELAAQARGEPTPESFTFVRSTQSNVVEKIGAPPHERRDNLPAQVTSFVGREREIADVKRLLETARLVTLTGAGGCGKTRLATEVAQRSLSSYRDGVWIVELAPLSDPALVPQAVAATFKLTEREARSHLDALLDFLGAKRILLVLDNCEHVIDACAELIGHVLARCPNLHVLATSRETLRLPGEAIYPIPSLTTPSQSHVRPERALDYEAVQLFVERARAADFKFELADDTVQAVTRICRQLEGIPLALELSAGLARTMTVSEIAARLDAQRGLPSSGSRTTDQRHQTMRRALDWSYDLLSPSEGRLLARLTVFTGGWTAEAAEAICGESDTEVLPLLDQLVHKSLVLTERREGRMRYRLLEPIRQYAGEKLRESGQVEAMRQRHLSYFLDFAERGYAGLVGYEHGAWLKRLKDDHDNLLAALAHSRSDRQDGETELRLAAALWKFWGLDEDQREGLARLEAALERCTTASAPVRAKALSGAARFADVLGHMRQSAEWAEESLKLSREIGDPVGVANSLRSLASCAGAQFDHSREIQLLEESLRVFCGTQDLLGIATAKRILAFALRDSDPDRAAKLFQEAFELAREMGSFQAYYALLGLGEIALQRGEHERACAFFEQGIALAQEMGRPNYLQGCVEGLSMADRQRSIALSEEQLAHAREAGDAHGLAQALHQLGHLFLDAGDFTRAKPLLEECLALWQELGIEWSMAGGVVFAIFDLGHIARFQGDYPLAVRRYNESLALFRKHSGEVIEAAPYACLGYVAFAQHDLERAVDNFKNSLLEFRKLGSLPYISTVLAGLAETARAQGRTAFAARLAGAAAALLPQHTLVTMRPIDRWDFERIVAGFRAQLNDPDIVAAWAEGQTMSMSQAIEYALSEELDERVNE